MKYLIWRDDYGETVDDALTFEDSDTDLEGVGTSYGEHYWDNYDGWECAWPIVFNIADADGKFLGKVSVEMETVPAFYGRISK